MKELFIELQGLLKSLTNSRGRKLFETVEIDSGQMGRILGFENTEGTMLYPAALFAPQEIINHPRPNGIYLVETRLEIKIITNDLVLKDPIDIFDIPEIVDNTLIDNKWVSESFVSIKKSDEVYPASYNNIRVYTLNYWLKLWNTASFEYRTWYDINDPEENPDYEAPMDLIQPFGFIDDDYEEQEG